MTKCVPGQRRFIEAFGLLYVVFGIWEFDVEI